MAAALRLARRGLGQTGANPSVGCIILSPQGRVLGRGRTGAGGRPHAETEALREAGEAAHGATAIVTLEPCAHHGKTPPCAEALIAAGLARVVIALRDPFPQVDGKGAAALRAAGITVIEGPGESEAREIAEGFLLRVTKRRPHFTLKLGLSLDGRIAAANGESRWITGPEARAHAHMLRAQSDAILTGAATALRDDPMLNVRLPGLEHLKPARVVLDRTLSLPLTSQLVRSAKAQPVLIFGAEGADQSRADALTDAGCSVQLLPSNQTGLDLNAVATALYERGHARILVEGGGRLSAAFVAARLADRLAIFRSGKLMGGDAIAAFAPLGVRHPNEAPGFRRTGVQTLGKDLLETYLPTA